MLKNTLVALAMALGLAGCATSEWETAYTQVDPAQAASWRLANRSLGTWYNRCY